MVPPRRRRRPPPVLACLDFGVGTNQEAIVAELRRTLVEGGVPPGSELPLDDIATLFGVSRVPVREALKTLQGEGLVEHQPRHGYTVARLTRDDYVDLYIARHALEVAALRCALDSAGDADVDALRRSNEELTATLAAGDLRGWQRASRRFHEQLLEPSRMHQLLHLLRTIWNITEPVRPMTLLPASVLAQLQDEHDEILLAYSERRTERVLELFDRHGQHVLNAVASLPADHDAFAPPTE